MIQFQYSNKQIMNNFCTHENCLIISINFSKIPAGALKFVCRTTLQTDLQAFLIRKTSIMYISQSIHWSGRTDLPMKQMTDHFEFVTALPSIGSLGVSIRGSKDAHFAICNQWTGASRNFCYYIVLGGWENTKSVIRKCESGIPEDAATFPSGKCADALVSANVR